MGEHQIAIMALLVGHAATPAGDTHIMPLGIGNCRLCCKGGLRHCWCVFGKEIKALRVFIEKEKEKRMQRVIKEEADAADEFCQRNGHTPSYSLGIGSCGHCHKVRALAGKGESGGA